MSLDTDLDAFFGLEPVVVVYGPTTTVGTFDQGTRAEDFVAGSNGFAPVMADDPSVLVKTSLGVKVDSSITVDGRAYTVRDRETSADGKLTRLYLKKA